MQKPINLHIQEAKQNILNAVNSTGLDLSTLSMIVNEVKIAIDIKLTEQLQAEQKEYLEALKKENEVKEEIPELPKKQRIEAPIETEVAE